MMKVEYPFNTVIDLDKIVFHSTDTAAIKLPYTGKVGEAENAVIYIRAPFGVSDALSMRFIATVDGSKVTADISADDKEIIALLDRLFDPSGIGNPAQTGLAPYTCGFLHGLFVSWRLFRSTDNV